MNIIITLLALFFQFFAFSNEKKQIKFAINKESEPISFTENNEIKGLGIEIIREVFKLKKDKYNIVLESFPWARAQLLVKNGEFDAYITIKSKERDEYVNYSKIAVIPDSLFLYYSKDNANSKKFEEAKSMNDLKEFIFLDYIGDSIIRFHKDEDGFKNELSNNKLSVLSKINLNRGDLFLSGQQSAKYLIKKHKLTNIKSIKVNYTEGDFNYYLCIRKSLPESTAILNDFDEAMQNQKIKIKVKNIMDNYYK